jgi:hypothetical protein
VELERLTQAFISGPQFGHNEVVMSFVVICYDEIEVPEVAGISLIEEIAGVGVI